MTLRVVYKLTEEEHARLLEFCSRGGCTPSAMVKETIIIRIIPESPTRERNLMDMLRELSNKHQLVKSCKSSFHY